MEEEFPALEPGRLAGLAATVVRVRGAVSLEREKRRTMTDVAECLTSSGQTGRVTHRDASGGEWTITLGPSAGGSSRG